MFGWDELKERIEITDATVECPVKGCDRRVGRRKRKQSLRAPGFLCDRHRIYLSPSTFEYLDQTHNMLWHDAADLALWRAIQGVKRESRMARDNSEDALTWNVFRHLERHGLLGRFLEEATGRSPAGNSRLVYWSWCQRTCGPWRPLVDAALGFGESFERRSEPDLIVEDDATILFVENKLASGNGTMPSDPANPKKYLTGFDAWFSTVFRPSSSFQAVAVEGEMYELMRLWLIGTRAAHEAGRRFVLVNVMRQAATAEADIESRFGLHARQEESRRFVRLTWERIRDRVVLSGPAMPERDLLLSYLHGKTLGYAVRRQGRSATPWSFVPGFSRTPAWPAGRPRGGCSPSPTRRRTLPRGTADRVLRGTLAIVSSHGHRDTRCGESAEPTQSPGIRSRSPMPLHRR